MSHLVCEGDVGNGGSSACVGAGICGKSLYFVLNSGCKPKTAL